MNEILKKNIDKILNDFKEMENQMQLNNPDHILHLSLNHRIIIAYMLNKIYELEEKIK